jgi:hypothetical protein
VDISRSIYYYKAKGKLSDMDLAEAIEEIALNFPSYGYRRITAQLHRQKLKVNHKRVLRLMGIITCYEGPERLFEPLQTLPTVSGSIPT